MIKCAFCGKINATGAGSITSGGIEFCSSQCWDDYQQEHKFKNTLKQPNEEQLQPALETISRIQEAFGEFRNASEIMERRRLRDEFAMHALTGLLANIDFFQREDDTQLAVHAYKLSDAMLKAREVQS